MVYCFTSLASNHSSSSFERYLNLWTHLPSPCLSYILMESLLYLFFLSFILLLCKKRLLVFCFLLLSAKSVCKSVLCWIPCLIKGFKNGNASLLLKSLLPWQKRAYTCRTNYWINELLESCLMVFFQPQKHFFWFFFLATTINASLFTCIHLETSVDDMKFLAIFMPGVLCLGFFAFILVFLQTLCFSVFRFTMKILHKFPDFFIIFSPKFHLFASIFCVEFHPVFAYLLLLSQCLIYLCPALKRSVCPFSFYNYCCIL